MCKFISGTAIAVLATAIVLPVFAATPQTTDPVTTTTVTTTTDPVTTTTTPVTTTTTPLTTTTTPTTTNSITTPNPGRSAHTTPAHALVRRHGHPGRGSSLTVGVLWTGPFDGSLNGQQTTVTVNPAPRSRGPTAARYSYRTSPLVTSSVCGRPASAAT